MSRKRFMFWLDDTKQHENELIGEIDELKQKRSFASTIRDGIRLITSLRSGSLDVLFELFPYVKAEFLEYVETLQINSEQAEKKTLAAQNEALQATIAAQEKRIAQLEAAQASPANQEFEAIMRRVMREEMTPSGVKPQAQNGANSSGIKPLGGHTGNGGIKPIAGLKPLAPPVFDDDSDDDIILEVKQAQSTGQASQNFIKAMFALQETSR